MSQEAQKPQTYQAKHRFIQMSSRKIRPFADLVRGKFADEALDLLACYPNRGARFIEKVIISAVKNAEDRRAPHIENLEIVEIRVDSGPIAKRFRPKSRGSSSIYLKRMSHITVVVG